MRAFSLGRSHRSLHCFWPPARLLVVGRPLPRWPMAADVAREPIVDLLYGFPLVRRPVDVLEEEPHLEVALGRGRPPWGNYRWLPRRPEPRRPPKGARIAQMDIALTGADDGPERAFEVIERAPDVALDRTRLPRGSARWDYEHASEEDIAATVHAVNAVEDAASEVGIRTEWLERSLPRVPSAPWGNYRWITLPHHLCRGAAPIDKNDC